MLIVLESLKVEGYDGTNFDALVQKQRVGKSHGSIEETLEKDFTPLDPHFVQYTLASDEGLLGACPRLNKESLSYFSSGESVVSVMMHSLIMEIDLKDEDGLKRRWKDNEFHSWYSRAVSGFPDLRSAIVYESKHGAKVVWKLSQPVPASDGWDTWYLQLCDKYSGIGPGGEGFDRQRCPWNSTFRVPRSSYYHANSIKYGELYEEGLQIDDTMYQYFETCVGREVSVPIASNGSGRVMSFSQIEEMPDNVLELKTALHQQKKDSIAGLQEIQLLPLWLWGTNNPSKVAYTLWWAIGTNIRAIGEKTDDLGRSVFHEFSQFDTERYDEAECDKKYDDICHYFDRGKGPITYKRMREYIGDSQWTEIHGSFIPQPSSSLAGTVRKRLRSRNQQSVLSSGKDGPLNSQDVIPLLALKSVGSKGNKRNIVDNKRRHNLKIIFERDELFHNRLRCNLLGCIDEWAHPDGKTKTLADPDLVPEVVSYLSLAYGVDFTDASVERFFSAACFQQTYHPVQRYLYDLTWDGKDRIPDLLKFLDAPDNSFTRMVIRKWLIAAVARPLQIETSEARDYSYLDDGKTVPMKVDETLVLMGAQGSGDYGGKTQFFTSMVPESSWYCDNLPSITTQRKDASITVLDSWIIELGEIDVYKSGTKKESLKAFQTAQTEKFRRPYDRGNRHWARTCVFVGTTNKGEFLDDPTGDRRYLVLPVGQKIDIPQIRTVRDQLWAQAVYMFESGERWWLQGNEKDLQDTANSEYRCYDATEEYIKTWLDEKAPDWQDERGDHGPAGRKYSGGFTALDVAASALGKMLGDASNKDLQAIGITLRKLGYTKCRKTVDGKQKNLYIKFE